MNRPYALNAKRGEFDNKTTHCHLWKLYRCIIVVSNNPILAVSVCNYNTIKNSAVVNENALRNLIENSENTSSTNSKKLAEINYQLILDLEAGKFFTLFYYNIIIINANISLYWHCLIYWTK